MSLIAAGCLSSFPSSPYQSFPSLLVFMLML
jgi:hypothetical protein